MKKLLTALSMILPLILLCGGTPRAYGQLTTADIAGTVTDATGAIVPNAQIQLEDLGTHSIRTTVSNSAGDYTFTFLEPGNYSVTIKAPGFSDYKVRDLTVSAGDHARADAKLQVGQASQTVEVSSQTPLLQADSVEVSTTIPETQVQDLPTQQRNLTSLVILTPGANEAASVDGLNSGQRPDDRRLTSSFSVNGADSELNNNQIDGTDNNERIIGTIGVKPLLDSIQEVTVQTNDYTPETGRSAGGVVNVITKRGTNKFHGSLYEFLQNDATQAKNPFAAPGPTPELRQNDFGGSLGGPIWKNKTFFFGGAEWFRYIAGAQVPSRSVVPTLAQEQNPQAVIDADPYTAGMTANPISLNLLKLFPAPNIPSATLGQPNFIYQPTTTKYMYTVDARIDHQFSPNDLFYARYTSNNLNAYIPAELPNQTINGVSISPGSGQYGYVGPATDIAYNGQLNYTHIFTSRLLVELKAAYTRIDNKSNSPNSGTNAATAVGFPSNIDYSAASSGLPLISIANFAPLGDANFLPIADLTNTYQYYGTVTYTRGRHNFVAGGTIIRRQARNQQSNNAVGNINFGLSSDTGTTAQDYNNDLATFLVGAFTAEGRNIDLYTPNYRSWEPGVFVQDTWRATPNLTLVYGLRYDVYTPFTEAAGRISNYDPVNHVLMVPAAGYNFLKAQGADLTGIVSSTNTAGIPTTYSNFAPRVGFADTIHPGTVVRGGFGIAYFPGNYTSNASLKNAPFNAVYAPSVNGQGCQSTLANQIETAAAAPSILPACDPSQGQTVALSQGIPIPSPQALDSANLSLPDNVDKSFRTSYMIQFNTLVEHQFGKNVLTIGYVGQLGRHLPATINDINVPDPHTATIGSFLTTRPTASILPGLGGVGMYYSTGSSSYNALQISFERRLSQGLTITSNYTWSHAIDDVTDLSYEGQEGWGNLDPFDISKYETGSSDLDLRNRLAFAATYELPFFKSSHGFEKAFLGGWQTNAIWIWNSGSPFSITDNYSYPGNSIYSGIGGGPTRPLMIGDPHLAHRGISEWFNRAAFETPLPGQFGTTPRNSLTGPEFEHFDFSIFKDFALWERTSLEFRAEAFNLTNTPAYFVENDQNQQATTNEVPLNPYYTGAPLAPASVFGQVMATNPGYVPRTLQFALKLKF